MDYAIEVVGKLVRQDIAVALTSIVYAEGSSRRGTQHATQQWGVRQLC